MDNQIKNQITKNIKKLLKEEGFTIIYCGITYRTLRERLKEHNEEEPNKYKGMKIKKIIDTLFDKNEIKKYEQFLIKYLNKNYKEETLNIQKGGQGIKNDTKNFKLYVCYK